MKIKEIITEVRAGKVPGNYKQASTGIHTFGDGEKTSADYAHYRLGLALACADGKGGIEGMDPKTFYGKKHTAHPFTSEEADMLKQSYKAVGASHKDLNKGNLKSMEPHDTHRHSPVAPKKKNKYGV